GRGFLPTTGLSSLQTLSVLLHLVCFFDFLLPRVRQLPKRFKLLHRDLTLTVCGVELAPQCPQLPDTRRLDLLFEAQESLCLHVTVGDLHRRHLPGVCVTRVVPQNVEDHLCEGEILQHHRFVNTGANTSPHRKIGRASCRESVITM